MNQGSAARVAAVLSAALLAAGTPMAWAADPAVSAKPATALTVLSEPAGAAVYVDGELKGETPVAVEGIAAGDHSVRLMKDGFLENSRVMSLPASGHSVQVALTPTGSRPHAAMQVEPGTSDKSGGGGGGKKALLIGLGVAAVGAGAFVALRDTNKPPVVSGVTANPAVALQSATTVTFSANATDPDNDTLTYAWDFGDSGTGSGASPTHVYTAAGTFNVSLSVSDPKGKKATGTTSVQVKSLAGAWRGTLSTSFNTTVNIAQTGTSLSGNYADTYGISGPISGSVSSPNRITLVVSPNGYVPFTFSGTVEDSVNRITGSANGSGFVNAPWTLTRQ